ncbi:MAG: hypothetical protein KDA65_11610 [Planctomycetaceae bacterium]|nr:hypothetical protein [Planctomycetaceae bacterium]
MSRELQARLAVAVVFLCVMMLCSGWLYLWGAFAPPKYEDRPFNSTEWKAWHDTEKPWQLFEKASEDWTRHAMLEDLIENYDLASFSRSKLIDLFGEPTFDEEDPYLSKWDVGYLIGLENDGAFAADYMYLVFKFDVEGKIVKYQTTVN